MAFGSSYILFSSLVIEHDGDVFFELDWFPALVI